MDAERREFALDLAAPLETASGTIEQREGIALRIAEDGAVGVGEATPLPGWTESPATCRERLAAATTYLDDGDPAAALDAVDESPAARHAVHLALADLRARQDGVPLYRYLGSVGRVERVPVNATIGVGSPDDAAAAARGAVEQGFQCLKLKVGAGTVEEAVERVETVREALPRGIALRADANGSWDREQAGEALRAFADSGVEYVEQPLAIDDLEGHADLRQQSAGVGVALDESLRTASIDDVLDAGAADVVVLKPMVLGGLDRARRIAIRARREGVAPVVTTTVDAVVARTGAVHFAASIPGVDPCGLATAERLADDLAPDPAPITEGDAVVPQGDGLGTRGPWEHTVDGENRR
ncbi:o-succinylbenzoate synthase [Natronoarchaeum philippinense]|uniref:o-succinylbenzoate synthase n=1 Tax=Natronoarchaeum philippinense TaxID=558529 RepID=A0A285NAG0_NATPI|nr:o-succinylbenzoate synthase [Natronoarchaeum philippinense]SNZ04946.1 o-succinylbenzoate synthase [Natronoarchaeum philippinense]